MQIRLFNLTPSICCSGDTLYGSQAILVDHGASKIPEYHETGLGFELRCIPGYDGAILVCCSQEILGANEAIFGFSYREILRNHEVIFGFTFTVHNSFELIFH